MSGARRAVSQVKSWLDDARRARIEKQGKKRLDIQGLRMIAVAVVVLDHLLDWPSGGFVGVDVFFVVSGFLITGLLLREYERSGKISFVEFYRRRVRRIMPVALLVLAVTVGASSLLFFASRASSVTVDALWSALFAANWHFASSGTDYFAQSEAISPLQHYWSLSVEEQFYFLWPWLMLGAFVLIARVARTASTPRPAMVAGIIIAVISVMSFAWALVETSTAPTIAYFSTFTRAWELGIGALLACGSAALARIPGIARTPLAYAGLGVIGASLFLISADAMFPAPGAALPVLGTAMVIAAGTGGTARGLLPLTNPVSTYVGDISYSIYLWHFPIVIFATSLLAEITPLGYVGILLGIFAVAALSYHLVELPLNTSPMLERLRAAEFVGEWSAWWARWKPTYMYGGFSALVLATALVVVPALLPPDTSAAEAAERRAAAVDAQKDDATSAPAAATSAPVGPALASLQDKLRSSLAASAWPEGMSEKVGEGADKVDTEAVSPAAAAPRVVLVGDSTAGVYRETLRTLFEERGWIFDSFAKAGCEFSELTVENEKVAPICPAHVTAVVNHINEVRPALVVVTNSYGTHTPSGSDAPVTTSEWGGAVGAAVDRYGASGARTVLLASPPQDKRVQSCFSVIGSVPADCISSVLSRYTDSQVAMQEIATRTNGVAVDSAPWFCMEGDCPSFVDDVFVKYDKIHATQQYMRIIAPAISERFDELGLYAPVPPSNPEV